MGDTDEHPTEEPLTRGAFRVGRHRSGSTETLVLTGELDLATAPQLAAAVDAAIAEGVGKIVIDAAALSFIDSAGVNVLVHAWHDLKGRATMPVVITDLQPMVRRVLDVCGITGLVTE